MVKLVATDPGEPALAPYLLRVESGATIYRAGETGGALFVVQEGRVELLPGGVVCEPGDVFGELGALSDEPRESTARALAACRLWRLDGPTLAGLVQRQPELGLDFLWRVARRAPPTGTQAVSSVPAGRPRLCHESGQEFALPDGDAVVVGRRSGNVTPDLDLTPVDTQRSLSRRHARIVRDGGGFVVQEETGVPNGTFVRGSRLQPGQAVPLQDGDEIGFGVVVLHFRI